MTRPNDPLGGLLNSWFAAGTAAGLEGITYENRDGGHSLFSAGEWPQLKVYVPTEEEIAKRRNIGPAIMVRPMVLLGNCSMAAPPKQGGCLPRFYLDDNAGTSFLVGQYLEHNLFVYPCHLDHNVGWNGVRGWGDLFPANSPYTVVSQGSSFTDQPFLKAFFGATAAFPPETQKILIRSHLLMPTLQALFRRSNKQVRGQEDYFTGAAHPPVFRGDQIDAEKFAHMAHDLKPEAVPPLPMLLVVHESPVCVPGRDFFEGPEVLNETLSSSPCLISRVFRSSAQNHEITISARRTMVPNKQLPVVFKWVLLQGDPARVRIAPADDGSEAKISVSWHPEMRLPSGMATHRVDIGVFAGNGTHWSAPAFICFYMLPNEARFYRQDGRLEEICYEAANSDSGVPASDDLRWTSLGRSLATQPTVPGNQLLLQVLPKDAVKALVALANEMEPRQAAWRKLNDDPAQKREASDVLEEIHSRIREMLDTPLGKETLRGLVETAVYAIANTPDLFVQLQEPFASMAREAGKTAEFDTARQRAVDAGLLVPTTAGHLALYTSVKALTAGDRAQIRALNLSVLATALLPNFLERSNDPAWVDPRLSLPKSWRDIYLYDKDGNIAGWKRITRGRQYHFDPIGRLLPDGKSTPPLEVRYFRDTATGNLLFAPK